MLQAVRAVRWRRGLDQVAALAGTVACTGTRVALVRAARTVCACAWAWASACA
jgi:hypothetical protein